MMKTRTNLGREYIPPTSPPIPWLVIPHGEDAKKIVFFSVSGAHKTFIRKTPREIRRKDCYASNNGWLLMIETCLLKCCLWNPATQEIFKLPKLEVDVETATGMWTVVSPTENSDLMVLFVGGQFFLYWQLEDHKWTKQDYDLAGEGPDQQSIWTVVSLKDGRTYAITNRDEIALLERRNSCGNLSVRVFNNFVLPDPEGMEHWNYLVESCGGVYLVHIYTRSPIKNEALTIGIFKVDFSREVFEKVECIGGRIFFISIDGCTSFSATKLGLKGNCVYIPFGKELYKFDLEDESLSISLPCPNMLLPSFTPFWFVPSKRSIEYIDDAEKQNETTTTKVCLNVNADCLGGSDDCHLIYFPGDILQRIATHLCVAADYMNFRQVSKTVRLSVPRLQLPTQYPLLMFSNKGKSRFSFSDPVKNITYSFHMPELLGAKIHFSRDGWLLMSRDNKSPFFFNPFTKTIHQLPDLPSDVSDWHLNLLFFSSVPTSQDCVVLATKHSFGHAMEMYLVQPGQHDWSYFLFEYEEWFFPSTASPVFHDGALYFLGTKKFLGVLNLSDKSWTILQTPRPCCLVEQSYLLECCGELTSVFMGRGGRYVYVYRFDRENMNWQRIRDLKDETMFLSRTTSVSLKVVSESMKNRIYFPISSDDDYLSYSLETLRWHSSFADRCKEDVYGTSEKLRCTWIQPCFE